MKQNWHTGRRVMVHICALFLILMSHGTETFASTLDASKGGAFNGGTTSVPLGTFQVIENASLSAEQRAYIESVRKTPGVHNQDDFYVLAWGEKPNLGYQLEFVSQETSWELLKVNIRLHLPEPGEFYPDLVNYPYLAGTLTLPPYNTVSFLDADTGEELFTTSNTDGVSYRLTSSDITLKWGSQPSTGYTISIDQMERKANQLHVYYSLVRPGPETTEASVVTFPSATAVIPEGREPIDKVILVRKQLSERWEMRTNIELDKIWTLRFSLPVDSASVNTNNIYVMEAGTVVPTTIAQGADSATYCVTPVNKYQRGHSYSLHVSQDIYSLAVGKEIGQRIKMGIIVPFTTEGNFYN